MPAANALRNAALKLPRKARAHLARDLIVSLGIPPVPPAADAVAWPAELERRADEAASGAVSLEEWGVVRERISEKLRKRRA